MNMIMRYESNKCLIVVLGCIMCALACKIPKMTNAPAIPESYYTFNKSSTQVLTVLDSVLSNNQVFFKDESDEPEHLFLNLKNDRDTITFVIFLEKEESQEIDMNESSTFFVMTISRYVNIKSDESRLSPKIDSVQKKIYLDKLDRFIITPIRQRIDSL